MVDDIWPRALHGTVKYVKIGVYTTLLRKVKLYGQSICTFLSRPPIRFRVKIQNTRFLASS